ASLSRGGAQAVAWYPDLGGDGTASGLLFYGHAQPSVFSSVTPYRLDLEKPGTTMKPLAVNAAASSPPASFGGTEHLEKDLFAATVIDLDPSSDYWFWEF